MSATSHLRPHLQALRVCHSGHGDQPDQFFNKAMLLPETIMQALSSCNFEFMRLVLLQTLHVLLAGLERVPLAEA